MIWFYRGYIVSPLLGGAWMTIVVISVSVIMTFCTGDPYKPEIILSFVFGALFGSIFILMKNNAYSWIVILLLGIFLTFVGYAPINLITDIEKVLMNLIVNAITVLILLFAISKTILDIPFGSMSRYEFENCLIRFLVGFGYIFFTAIVVIPFYVMIMTSLKSQSKLMLNPLDFSVDIAQGISLFRSYFELFSQFNFGTYLMTSFLVSLLTVIISLIFAIPGAYAVGRLRFRGRAVFSRSILLIYMVPMIVLALPIYIGFSLLGLRNSVFGLIFIYPVTTIPVAIYMLQGYFRSLPTEVEEAGLMDGLSRFSVILKITLPLSLPALASVSLYIFMIAWNEFLLAFMLLDDPSKFTLTRGIAMLDSSEIPRQHLMAGSVIATIPIMVLFLGLERFMIKGLASGSVKG